MDSEPPPNALLGYQLMLSRAGYQWMPFRNVIPPLFSLLFCAVTLSTLSTTAELFNERLLLGASAGQLPAWVNNTFEAYFFLYMFGSLFPFVLFLLWASEMDPKPPNGASYAPFVTIIVPAFNEEANVLRSIVGALRQDYPAYEIIVLDDGSADLTPYLVETAAVTFIRLPTNRGKAAALNAGIRRAKGDVLVFTDADSVLDSSAVRHLVGHLADPRTGAVAGRVVAAVEGGMLHNWQAVEYVFGQAIVKAAQSAGESSALIYPGPVCAYRRDLLLRLGGFKDDTLVEDFDATLEVVGAGYRVVYEPKAVALTDTPRGWRELARQRLRWSRGGLQIFRKHRRLLFAPAVGVIGVFWLPYLLIIGFGAAVFEFIVFLTVPPLALASGHPLATMKAGTTFVLLAEVINAIVSGLSNYQPAA